jgi:hypothetical protein
LPKISLLIGLPESSGGEFRSYPELELLSPWLSTLTYHPGTNNIPVGGRSFEA